MSALLGLQILGTFQLSYEQEIIKTFNKAPRLQSIVAYLALHPDITHSREQLATLFWPYSTPRQARTNLRQLLFKLRHALPQPEQYLYQEKEMIRWHPEAVYRLDVDEFQWLLVQSERDPFNDQILQEAVDIYRGELLPAVYDEWVTPRRHELHVKITRALERLIYLKQTQSAYIDAIQYANRLLTLEPYVEAYYLRLMQLQTQNGDRLSAMQTYQTCVAMLQKELNVSPSQETERIYQRIIANKPLDLPEPVIPSPIAGVTSLTVPSEIKHNLPVAATAFVGRDNELASLEKLFAKQENRLVTILGPGGIGKTRLALAFAERQTVQTRYTDGVFFVDLARLAEGEQMVNALAEALDIRFHGGVHEERTPRLQLLDILQNRRLLLVLDNFEHLLVDPDRSETISGANLVTDILVRAPGAFILVTSRERLRLRQEQVFTVAGLAFPSRSQDAFENGIDGVSAYTAVQLFLQVAQRSNLHFSLSRIADVADIVSICQLTDGMPLAIEMAASWVDTLSLQDIVAGLRQGLDLLETDLRDVPPRHRSVRNTFDYTWRRLDAREQVICAQLSIFRDGFTRAAAQAITGASRRQLSRFVHKSLIQFNQERDRYQVHELLRQFGAEKLNRDPTVEKTVKDRHSTYYCQVLGQLASKTKGTGQEEAFSAIDADIENMRLAWNHALNQQDIESIDTAMEALHRYFWNEGSPWEGIAEFEKAESIVRAMEQNRKQVIIRGRLLAYLSWQHDRLGQTARATERAQQSLDLLQPLGAQHETYLPLIILAKGQESLAETRRLLQESLQVARENGDQWAIGDALFRLGVNAHQAGEYELAERRLQEAHNQFRKNDDAGGATVMLCLLSQLMGDRGLYQEALALALEVVPMSYLEIVQISLGKALMTLGEYAEAADHFQKAVDIMMATDAESLLHSVYFLLGEVACHTKEYGRAGHLFQESLAGARRFGDREWVARNHDALGRVYRAQGDERRAKAHLKYGLQTALSFGRPPIFLDCLASAAELLATSGERETAILLALLVTDHAASRAKTRERAADVLTQLEKEVSHPDRVAIQQHLRNSDLETVAEQVLEKLETPLPYDVATR